MAEIFDAHGNVFTGNLSDYPVEEEPVEPGDCVEPGCDAVEPEVEKRVSDVPDGLSDEAGDIWREMVRAYDLDAARLFYLERVLEAFDRMREAQKEIEDEGITIKDKYLRVKKNPACDVERDSKSAMLGWFKQMNLDLKPLNHGPGRPSKAVTQLGFWD